MSGSQDAAGSGQTRRVGIGSGRVGPVRSALLRAVADARADDRITAEHEVRLVLAERYADLVDRAARAGDGPALLKAGGQLLELMDTLPIRTGGEAGDGGDRGKLLQLLDSPPALGD